LPWLNFVSPVFHVASLFLVVVVNIGVLLIVPVLRFPIITNVGPMMTILLGVHIARIKDVPIILLVARPIVILLVLVCQTVAEAKDRLAINVQSIVMQRPVSVFQLARRRQQFQLPILVILPALMRDLVAKEELMGAVEQITTVVIEHV